MKWMVVKIVLMVELVVVVVVEVPEAVDGSNVVVVETGEFDFRVNVGV